MNKQLKRILSASAALCMALSCTTAVYADSTKKYGSTDKLIKILNTVEKNSYKTFLNDEDDFIIFAKASYTVDSSELNDIVLPEKYDLRDVDGKCYVTGVKDQSPYGTCWAFGTMAASEISLATALGIDLNTATDEQKKNLDLSERHLAWFYYQPVPSDDERYPGQAGEGYYLTTLDNIDEMSASEITQTYMNTGSATYNASYLFGSQRGPVLECEVPYINNEGYYYRTLLAYVDEEGTVTDVEKLSEGFSPDYNECSEIVRKDNKDYASYYDLYYGKIAPEAGKPYFYSLISKVDGDWSVDRSKKYNSVYKLKDVNYLPNPANHFDTIEYEYYEPGILAIKREIFAGHGVTVGIKADNAMPGDEIDPNNCYLKFSNLDGSPAEGEEADIWAEYVFDKDYDPSDPDSVNHLIIPNHGVTIVGYDDNFPKEYFNDPKGLIPENGAFILKNSWGSIGNPDPLSDDYWGNGGSGYFYMSYYDQSFCFPVSYVFDTEPDKNTKPLKTAMYDFLPVQAIENDSFTDFEVVMSSVFTADENEFIDRIGFDTGTPNGTVDYSVYLLSDSSADPTDGVKAAEGTVKPDFAGYHIIGLESRIPVRRGQKYSVVIKRLREDGKYEFPYVCDLNRNGNEHYNEVKKQKYIEKNGSEDGYNQNSNYSRTVVNPGENFVGVMTRNGMEWTDWTEVISGLEADNDKVYNNGLNYDNFCIRAYPQADNVMIENVKVGSKKSYKKDDVITGRIAITNYGTEPLENVEVSLSLGKLGIDNVDGKIASIAPGKTKVINYKHKVNRKNVKKDELTSSVTLTVNGKPVDISEDSDWTTFTVKTKNKK